MRYGALGLYYWTKAFYPVISLADWLAKTSLSALGVEMTRSWTEEETEGEADVRTRAGLREAMGDVLRRGVESEERREEVLGALEIGTEPVRDVAVPREAIVALSTDNTFAENLAVMETHPHTRFPLVGDSLDEFEGIVYTPVVLREYDALSDGDLTIGEIAHEPMSVAADASVAAVIDAFQARKQELALVVDGGDVTGMVTPTDAFEEITGELGDPVEEPDI
ncbi:CBS domain-containing protein [Halarchaeum acidiphilum]|uniref:CBS domain-containing protein n=1 Tax=Halarchaeum acidiphilum TaxID=489138 RepID=UPI00036692FB